MVEKIFRKLPLFKGKYRLARLLLSSTIKNARDIEVQANYGIQYKIPNLTENIGFNIYVDGVYEKEYIQFIIDQLPQNGVLLDLGANIGSICIPIARLRPDVKIVAVEASPRVFSYLRHNVERNGCRNIFIENFALAEKDNERVSFYSPEDKFGKGSMSAVFTSNEEIINTITVDSLVTKYDLARVDVIKIDVEGYESMVFKGASSLLTRKDAPAVLFEFAPWAENLAKGGEAGSSQRVLKEAGYALFDLTDPGKKIPLPQVLTSGGAMLWATKKAG